MSFKKLAGCATVLLLVVLGLAVALFVHFRNTSPVEPELVEVEVEDVHKVETPFEGRMVLPSAAEFRVLDNSAGRSMEDLALFMKGRAAGLHWLANDHFKKAWRNYRKTKGVADVHALLSLSVDSMGVFQVDSVVSFDSDDRAMVEKLQDHIKKYWRYRRSTSGKTEFIVPITWTSKY